MLNLNTRELPTSAQVREKAPSKSQEPSPVALKMVGDHGQTIAYGWPVSDEELFEPLYDHACKRFHEVDIRHSVRYAWAVSTHAVEHATETEIRRI